MSEGEGFLSRWSRRKRATGDMGAAPAPPAPVAPDAVPSEDAAPRDARVAFDPASLPPVESLTAESDFAAFLGEEVPAALRRAALRRAWTLDSGIRDFVGPADYAWDFNAPEGMAGFSLELTGDMERLIAQAIGSGDPPGEGSAEEEASPEADVVAAAPAPGPAPPEHAPPEHAPPEHAPDVPLAEAPSEPAAEGLPAPAERLLAVASPELAPVRRRHGGALPS